MRKPSILIVDDEPDNFDVIETLLTVSQKSLGEHEEYQLNYSSSGQHAIANLDSFKPDLILLDVMMPGMDGIEVCRKIKGIPKWQAIPIIMVTALNTKSDLAHCLTAGADDFIAKPINALELGARVNSMLRIKQQYDDIENLSVIQENTINILQNTLDQLHGNLTSKFSHEMKTPLHGISGNIQLLQMYIETMDKSDILETLDIIELSETNLKDLIEKFLTYLQLEVFASQNKLFKFQQTLLTPEIIEVQLTELAQKYDRHNDLIFNLKSAYISIPEQYLLLIFRELVDNALKFSSVDTKIKIVTQIINDRILNLSVHNLGRAMTEKQIAQISALTQFERSKYEQQGLGMGLAIIQKIAELGGGNLSIKSIYKQEITVNIMFPIIVNN